MIRSVECIIRIPPETYLLNIWFHDSLLLPCRRLCQETSVRYSRGMEKVKKQSKRVLTGIVGTLVLVAGIIMIPYPGPGWLIVFAGLGILATEFAWAQRMLDVTKGYYDKWTVWVKSQPLWMRVIVFALTALVVVMTLWLVNAFGLMNAWLNLPFDWATSPLI